MRSGRSSCPNGAGDAGGDGRQVVGRGGHRDQGGRRDPRHRDIQDRERVREPGRRAAAPDRRRRGRDRAGRRVARRGRRRLGARRRPGCLRRQVSGGVRRPCRGSRGRGAGAAEPRRRGRRIRYLALGEGEGVPIVLIHGFGGDLNNWQFNQEALAAGRPTYAIDLPGHGGSREPAPGRCTSAPRGRGGRFHGREGHPPRRIWSAIRLAARSPWTSR